LLGTLALPPGKEPVAGYCAKNTIFSWKVLITESAENAAVLVCKAHLPQAIGAMPWVLHSANGPPIKGTFFGDAGKSSEPTLV
jgi:hypothetical protein